MSSLSSTPRAAITGLGLSIAVVGLAACGSQAGGASNAATGNASDSGAAAAKAAVEAASSPISDWPAPSPLTNPVKLSGKKIFVVPIGEAVPATRQVTEAATDALTKAGAHVEVCDGKFEPTAMANCLQAAASQKPDGIVTYGIDYSQLRNVFDGVVKTGIPTLVAMGGLPKDSTPAKNLAFMDTSPRVKSVFETLADLVVAQEGPDSNILWLTLTDNSSTVTNLNSAKAYLKQMCPGCKVTDASFGTSTLNQLPSNVSAALVSHPDINVVVQPVDNFVPATLQGINSAGFGNKVKLLSAFSDVASLQRIKAGQQAGDVSSSLVYDGWQVANSLVRLMSGESQESYKEPVRVFNHDNVGDLALNDQAYNSAAWYGDESFKQKFLHAWGAE